MTETHYKLDGFDVGIGCLAIIIVVPLRLWALTVLWGWFAVPLGAVALTFSAAFGLWAMWWAIAPQRQPTRFKDETDYYASLGAQVLQPILALLIGLIVRGPTL